jgi:hypothetical protein
LLLIAGGPELDDRRPDQSLQRDRGVQGEYRCIAADLRNANSGQSSGPLEIERPWDACRRPSRTWITCASTSSRYGLLH